MTERLSNNGNAIAKMTHLMNDIKISSIVCTYNRANILSVCLESLVNQTLNKKFYEIIVVDNNSTDSTTDIVRDFASRYSNLHYYCEKQQGLSHARNRGYIEATGVYVAYIDDDGRASENWLKSILEDFETILPQPCVVGGPIYPYYQIEKPSWFLDEYEIRQVSRKSRFVKFKHSTPIFSGSNIAFKKNVLIKYQGFSPEYGVIGDVFRAGEEIELSTRIYKDLKDFWYDNKAIVKHLVPFEKMSLQYILRRNYSGGHAYQRLKHKKLNIILFVFLGVKCLLKIVFNAILLAMTVSWGKRGWQNRFIRYASPIAGNIGILTALCETKYSVNIMQ